MKQLTGIELEIETYSYWEHFKAAKELALILPPDHPKRKKIEKAANEILERINCKSRN